MSTAKDLRRWLLDYQERGTLSDADVSVVNQSYASPDHAAIHVRSRTTGWSFLVEPDPTRLGSWHVVAETGDTEVALSASEIADLTLTLRAVREMSVELKDALGHRPTLTVYEQARN